MMHWDAYLGQAPVVTEQNCQALTNSCVVECHWGSHLQNLAF